MDIRNIILSQFLASLEMLRNVVKSCPKYLWEDPSPKNKFWHIAYHALFYTHLYIQVAEKDFTPWEKHLEEIGSLSPPSERNNQIEPLYSKDDILTYLTFCQDQIETLLPEIDLDNPKSGFYWLPFSKLELQFYNIRHIQQHTGELCERLGKEANLDIDWVGMMPKQG